MNAIWLIVAILAEPANIYLDVPIAKNAIALSEPGRYQASHSFDDTMTFYKRVFMRSGGVRLRSIINLPGIKAMHVQSMDRESSWLGINIYEKQGHVKFFIMKRDTPPKKKKFKRKRRKH